MKLSNLITESSVPIGHKSSMDGEYIILHFRTEEECESARRTYDQLNGRDTTNPKRLALPLLAVVRFLVKELQNQVYNPSTKI